ncbi:MAG: serine hydrolase domain-containing protein [Bryobacteraceae bacterium]
MRKINRRGAVALGVAAATPGSFSATGFEDHFRAAVERHKIPVAVAIVAGKDRVLLRASHGRRDTGGNVPVDGRSIVAIASMTKAVTSVAALQLVERNVLALDGPAHAYLPELRELPILEGFDDAGTPRFSRECYAVTLRQLLSHTAGFGYAWTHPLILTIGAFDKPFLVNKPGSQWLYGTSVDWVGRIVEAVSNQRLEAYFQRHILQPLKMDDTSFLVPLQKFDRFTSSFQRGADGVLEEAPRVQPPVPPAFNGGGGLFSTAEDYTRFTQMILNRGQSPTGDRILQPQSVHLMSSNQSGDLDAGKIHTTMPQRSRNVDFHPGERDQFGLGFLINPKAYEGGRSAGSLAWAGLRNTFYWIDPKRAIGAVLLMNFLPFCDDAAMGMLRDFERSVYSHLP